MGWEHAKDRRAWLLASVWLCGACADTTAVVGKFRDTGGSHAAPNEDAGIGSDASSPAAGSGATAAVRSSAAKADDAPYRVSIEPGSRDDVCKGKGPSLVGMRDGAPTPACAWRVERHLFDYGLCACEELRFDSDSFALDSFDSSQGAYKKGQTGSAIGVNGTITQLASDTQVLGSLISAGDAELAFAGQMLLIAGDLKQQAGLRLSSGAVRVANDLWLGGDAILGQDSLRVDHDAYQTTGHTGLTAASVAGHVITGDFAVPKPCDCRDVPVIDVPALVAQAKTDNDDAAAGVSPDALDLDMFATDWAPLPCGRLYFTRIAQQGISTYILSVTGRTAIFVQGDLHVGPLSTFFVSTEPSPGAELDLFVAGDVIIDGNSSLVLGDSSRPWAVRMYVGGEMKVTGNLSMAAQLYAPKATLELSAAHADVELFGSVFARKIRLPNRRMHYDRAILHAAAQCAAAPPSCDGCNQCPDDLACTSGVCAPCMRDADCCEPAVCSGGKCQARVSDWP